LWRHVADDEAADLDACPADELLELSLDGG